MEMGFGLIQKGGPSESHAVRAGEGFGCCSSYGPFSLASPKQEVASSSSKSLWLSVVMLPTPPPVFSLAAYVLLALLEYKLPESKNHILFISLFVYSFICPTVDIT